MSKGATVSSTWSTRTRGPRGGSTGGPSLYSAWTFATSSALQKVQASCYVARSGGMAPRPVAPAARLRGAAGRLPARLYSVSTTRVPTILLVRRRCVLKTLLTSHEMMFVVVAVLRCRITGW